MTRLILSLEEPEKSWLKRRSRETGESMAEIVRRAVRNLKEAEDESLEELLEATKGIWRKGDGLEYQRKIREEWDERLIGLGDLHRSSQRGNPAATAYLRSLKDPRSLVVTRAEVLAGLEARFTRDRPTASGPLSDRADRRRNCRFCRGAAPAA